MQPTLPIGKLLDEINAAAKTGPQERLSGVLQCMADVTALLQACQHKVSPCSLQICTVPSQCKDTPSEDNLDVRSKKSGTDHCMLTAVVLLSKDNSMYGQLCWEQMQ